MDVAKKLDQEVLAVVVPHSGQGTETFIRRYCLEICPERTVLVYFYRGADRWQGNGPVYRLPEATFGSVALWKGFRGLQKICGIKRLFGDPYTSHSLASFLRRQQVTCVFSQYLTAGWNVHPVVKRLGLRHVIRGHGFDVSATLEDPQVCRQYLELEDADAIVVPSPYQVERLRRIGLNKANLVSLPYGVDLPDANTRGACAVSRGDGTASVRLLAVGRMVRKKAPLAVMQAFLKAAESLPTLQLTYIGTGPLEAEVQEYLKRHDHGGRIRLAGAKSHEDVLRAMDEADIFIQHSLTDPQTGDQEGAPVAILEAMAHGLPVISTLHSGIPYLVVNGETGLLTPEGDVSAMAHSIGQLAQSQEKRREMGAAGRKRAGLFSWSNERQHLGNLLFPGKFD
jgi:glycosyltransferase involved in cell wall biosynthesis